MRITVCFITLNKNLLISSLPITWWLFESFALWVFRLEVWNDRCAFGVCLGVWHLRHVRMWKRGGKQNVDQANRKVFDMFFKFEINNFFKCNVPWSLWGLETALINFICYIFLVFLSFNIHINMVDLGEKLWILLPEDKGSSPNNWNFF